MLPENAPEKYKDPYVLWNSVELVEKAKDAQLLSSKDKKDNLLKSNIRRLIRIYDYLKWGTKNSMTKAPND